MTENTDGLSGDGRGAWARAQKEKAQTRKSAYNTDPNLCTYCNKGIIAGESEKLYDVLRKRFCDHTCAARHVNRNRTRNPRRAESKGRRCSKCEVLFTVTRKGDKMPGDKLCSGCKPKDIASYSKEELFNTRPNWQAARSAIQKHARTSYQNSGLAQKCLECGYSAHVEVCHIKPVSSFKEDALVSEINNVSNLVALCRNHHWEFDHGVLCPDRLRKAVSARETAIT